MKNNNLYILCVILLSSCGDSGTVTTDEPTPDTAIGLTLSKITATTSSSGESDTFTVKLKTKESVSVSISSSNTDAGSVYPTSLSFSESNWNVNQTVTVTGLCDAFHTSGTNKTTYNVVLSPSSANYSSTQNKTVTVSDNDKASFNVSSISGNVYEQGDNASFSVKLCSQPTSNVSIGVSSSDTTEGTVSTNSLTFSADNWSTAQTVSVLSKDDNVADDDVEFSIKLAEASSSDSNYNSLDPNDVTVINKDNDSADITISKPTLTTSEAGDNDSFTVVLDTGLDNITKVTVIPTSSNTSRATVSPSNFTFDNSTWNVAQTFTVTGVDDFIDNIGDNETYSISFSITSSAHVWNTLSLDNKTITGTNNDNDTATVLIDNSLTKNVSEFENVQYIYVKLSTIPTSTVYLGISSDDTTEGTVSPDNLSISPSNWNSNNTVTVSGINDNESDGTVTFNINFANSTSDDSKYNNLTPNKTSVQMKNIDDGND